MEDDRKYLAQKQPCKCGSSDAKTYYADGGSKCFSCGASRKFDPYNPGQTEDLPRTRSKTKPAGMLSLEEIAELPSTDIPARGITQKMAEEFGVRTQLDTSDGESHVAYYLPYYDDTGQITGYKKRPAQIKDFRVVGKIPNSGPGFGWVRVRENGMMLVITEGEYDAIAATQMLKMLNKNYSVISIPNGSDSAKAWVGKNLRRLEKIEKVVLCFDDDEAGHKAVNEVASFFEPGQCYIMSMPEGFNDPNDILLRGRAAQFFDAVNAAKEYRPDGIVLAEDTWELYKNRPEVQYYPFPESWKELNHKLHGIYAPALYTITSGTSAGKTQIMREMVYHYATTTDLVQGVISLEEPTEETVESYLALDLNKRIMLPDVGVTEEEERQAWLNTFGRGKLHLYDDFAGEEASVMAMIRYMALGLGCKAIWLDHLHMLLDGKDSEKDQVERMMLKLKKLTVGLDIFIGLIAHLKKSSDSGSSFEEGKVANLDDMKGSSAIKQLSNGVLVLSRDQMAEDLMSRNTMESWVKKARRAGRTGKADTFYFDDDTGRYVVVPPNELPY